jgi:hypothetical protein
LYGGRFPRGPDTARRRAARLDARRVWIIAYPLIVPASRGKAVLATLAAAAMDPVGLGINVTAGNPRPPASVAALIFLPTFIAAATALIVSRIVYQLPSRRQGSEMGS